VEPASRPRDGSAVRLRPDAFATSPVGVLDAMAPVTVGTAATQVPEWASEFDLKG